MRRPVLLLAAAVLLAGCAAPGSTTPAPTTASPTGSTSSSSATTATPVAAPVPPPTGTLRSGESWLTVGVAEDLPNGVYLPEAPSGGTDDYRCFVVDPHVAADSFITGVSFLPGNPHVVHHSILFRVAPQQAAAARAKDAADPRPGWECFGGPGLPATSTNPLDSLDSAPWLAGWAPGGKENVFPTGYGVPLAAGSLIVVQMHYNLRHATGVEAADSTHVRLRTTKAALAPLSTMLLPAPVELPCPAGATGPLCDRAAAIADVTARFGAGSGRTVAGLQLLCGGSFTDPRSGVTQSCTRYVRAPVTVRAAAGHMHLLGRSITIVANKGTSRQRTILSIPVWDFDNQSAQPLSKPLPLRAGDTVTVTCTHDPGLRKLLPELQGTPDRYVVWGEGTTDEMCLGILITS
ncbi:MAG: hypothetical protein U0R68_04190 [Candidatus Nanopelagicales bacterium]